MPRQRKIRYPKETKKLSEITRKEHEKRIKYDLFTISHIDSNAFQLFYKQCKKLIGITCDGLWKDIVEAVIQTGSNIIQTFVQYIPAKGDFKDKFEQNQITLIRGIPDIDNDIKIIEGNKQSQLKLVIHATMGLDLSGNTYNKQDNLN